MLENQLTHNSPQTGLDLPKTNYSFAKRQREMAKKQKKEEKRQKKDQLNEQSSADDALQPTEGDKLASDPPQKSSDS